MKMGKKPKKPQLIPKGEKKTFRNLENYFSRPLFKKLQESLIMRGDI